MSMFNKIKSLFIVEEEKKAGQEKIEERKESRSANKDLDKRMESAGVNKASINQFVKVLAEALENNNIEGYDYLEFKEALKSLDKLESDEAKKFLTAFTLAQTMGAERDGLVKSAEHYITVLEEEDLKFQNALQKQIDEKLNIGKKTIESKKKLISSKKAQLSKIQNEMGQLEEQVSKLESELSTSANKVATIKNSFQKAYISIKDQISNDIINIKKYIK